MLYDTMKSCIVIDSLLTYHSRNPHSYGFSDNNGKDELDSRIEVVELNVNMGLEMNMNKSNIIDLETVVTYEL